MKTIGIIKENNSSIVALTPENVRQLSNVNVLVETDAGLKAGYSNQEFTEAGAVICPSRESLEEHSEMMVTYNTPLSLTHKKKSKILFTGYPVRDDFSSLIPYRSKPITLYSLDLLPRTTLAQSMDILTSLASLSGYQAIVYGLGKSSIVAPMLSGAGGTLKPMQVLILGAGVAGLQAIATAKRMGAIVKAFDVRHQTKTEVESLGAEFIEILGSKEDQNSGGYAVQQDQAFNILIQATIANVIGQADLVICTAKIPGKSAPLLITKFAVENMKPGGIIIDLAASSGGNCELTKNNEVISHSGATIIGISDLFEQVPRSASILFGNNMTKYLLHYFKHEENELFDDLLQSTLVMVDGEIVNERLIKEINTY